MAYVDKAEIENNARSVHFRILKIEYLKETFKIRFLFGFGF